MTANLTTHEAADLAAVLDRLVDGRGRVGWCPVDLANADQLTREEASIVARAVPKRVAEFATGRALLRELLASDIEILRVATGAPVLPDGVVGSLAHDVGVAVGVISPAEEMRAVGIDVEPVRSIDDDMTRIIVRSDDITPDALTAFVAKEAAYKAWSVLGGDMLDHHDVQVIIDGDRYVAHMRDELSVTGQLGQAAGRIVACVFIPTT